MSAYPLARHACVAPVTSLRFVRLISWAVLAALCCLPVRAENRLVWSDEFDGTTIDASNWEHMTGDGTAYGLPSGWGNQELQYYTDRAENSFVADGLLHIVARRESHENHSYTSARLRTSNRREFLHGRFEARIKLPSGNGIWPALWMLPAESRYGGWAASGEIDIIETINVPDTAYGTIHFGGEWPDNVKSGGEYTATDADFPEDFHVFAIEWTPDEIRWFVDETCYHSETSANWYSEAAPDNERAPFDRPFHLLVNVAVGGEWPGPPDDTTLFPREMLVDWIRVWELDPQTGTDRCEPPPRKRPATKGTSASPEEERKATGEDAKIGM